MEELDRLADRSGRLGDASGRLADTSARLGDIGGSGVVDGVSSVHGLLAP